jgi:homoserine acetyltransferase
MRVSKRVTEEEKVAIKLGNILSDLRVDLELVGRYLARSTPTVVYNRLVTVTESATYEKEDNHNEYKY